MSFLDTFFWSVFPKDWNNTLTTMWTEQPGILKPLAAIWLILLKKETAIHGLFVNCCLLLIEQHIPYTFYVPSSRLLGNFTWTRLWAGGGQLQPGKVRQCATDVTSCGLRLYLSWEMCSVVNTRWVRWALIIFPPAECSCPRPHCVHWVGLSSVICSLGTRMCCPLSCPSKAAPH